MHTHTHMHTRTYPYTHIYPPQVSSPSSAVRHQAAAAAAALASVQPPSAARLLGSVLDTLEASTQLMAETRPAQAWLLRACVTACMCNCVRHRQACCAVCCDGWRVACADVVYAHAGVRAAR